MTLRLEQRYIDEMVEHALADRPNECCGIIAGTDTGPEGRATKLFRAKNAEASPYRYRVDDKDLFRIFTETDDNGWAFFAIYHSHVATEAYPSPTDVRLARGWPEAYYILVSLMDETQPAVRAFRITGEDVVEEAIEAV